MRIESRQNSEKLETLCETRKVLIFNEDLEDLSQLAKPFEDQGLEVYKCMSVETAKRCVEREEFDFALVDQGSRAFEGLRVVRHLIRYNRRTPFVVVTRCKDLLCCQQALALGALDYFEKPVAKTEIDRIIRNYLGASLKGRIEAEKYYGL
jgi:DNA-binding NtrC family response regulator